MRCSPGIPAPDGSPSQMSAALLAVGVSRCRSRQLWLTFKRPPTNHLAKGAFHCKTLCHGLNQTSSFFACLAQNLSGAWIDSWYSLRYCAIDFTCALAAKSLGGGKILSACCNEVMFIGCFFTSIN